MPFVPQASERVGGRYDALAGLHASRWQAVCDDLSALRGRSRRERLARPAKGPRNRFAPAADQIGIEPRDGAIREATEPSTSPRASAFVEVRLASKRVEKDDRPHRLAARPLDDARPPRLEAALLDQPVEHGFYR